MSARFRWGPPIGAGRFGVVHRAYDRTHDRWVALKTADDLERLRAEHATLRRVEHPNVVRAIALDEGPPPALAMELAEGPSLVAWARADVPRGAPRRGPRRNLPMAFGYELQEEGHSQYAPITARGAARLRASLPALASAIEAIHGAGVLHLDVSAENVRAVRRGDRDEPVLLDLGLAWDRATGGERLVAGTAASIAPELGLAPPTRAADWYALGVVLFEALTGRLPFDGGGVEVLVRKQTVEAPRSSEVAPGVPDDLDAICAGLLRRSPNERFDGAKLRERLSPS
ncbi:MAG: serine/threonine protein kinase [Myxococcales bacterium]|nr:serine/threonine protein kinase [Myxococcales bacterium]